MKNINRIVLQDSSINPIQKIAKIILKLMTFLLLILLANILQNVEKFLNLIEFLPVAVINLNKKSDLNPTKRDIQVRISNQFRKRKKIKNSAQNNKIWTLVRIISF